MKLALISLFLLVHAHAGISKAYGSRHARENNDLEAREYNTHGYDSRIYTSSKHNSSQSFDPAHKYDRHTSDRSGQESVHYDSHNYDRPSYDRISHNRGNRRYDIQRQRSPSRHYFHRNSDRRRNEGRGFENPGSENDGYEHPSYEHHGNDDRQKSPGNGSPSNDRLRNESPDHDYYNSDSLVQENPKDVEPLLEYKDTSHEDASHEDTSHEDTEREDTEREGTEREDTEHEDTEHEDTKREGTEREDTEREDSGHEDTEHEDTEHEDTEHEDTEREDTEREGTKHEDTEHEDTEHEATEHYATEREDTEHEAIEQENTEHEAIEQEDTDLTADESPVCARTCRYTGEDVFRAGQQYQYVYQGKVSSKILASEESGESSMSLTATLIISANTPCDLKLQVVDVVVEDVSDEDSSWFIEATQNHDLHFSYQGGRIEYLCPHENEDVIITNFKRGILSVLQTSLSTLDEEREVIIQERDVSGECETKYVISHEESLMVVHKMKSNCHSNTYLPYIPHANHAIHTVNTNLPFLRSNQSCQMFRHDVWERVECTQDIVAESPYQLASFTVSSSLLLQEEPYEIQDNFLQDHGERKKVSLQMDLEGAVLSDEARHRQYASDVLDQIADTMGNLLSSTRENFEQVEQRPHMFSRLVSLLGLLQQEEDVQDVWITYGNQEHYREFLVDALLICEHGPCIQLVSNLAQEDHPALPPTRLTTWLAGLHFHTYTDPLAISYILDVAKSKAEVINQAVMAVSSMVHRVCQQDPQNCHKHAQPFLNYVQEEVGDLCGLGETKEQQQQVQLMLRALGNAGVLPYHQFPEKCYMNQNLAPEVRVAALQTYRRAGCAHSKAPWKILKDGEEQVEVRIAAYLSLVPCATDDQDFFSQIKTLLEKEEVNQVGSYIWTHIRNLAEQPGISEHNRWLAKLMAQHTLQDKFNTNAFRSSRNYRYTHFSEMLNVAGSLDGDIIFTPDSYLPRHAALNLTLDLTDRSINVFEFGGDFSGLEKYIERFFGKGGYFENEGIQKAIESLRPKRDIHDGKIQEFQRLYDKAKTVNELELSKEEEEARASLYLRIFGNEVVFLDNALQSNPFQFLQQLVSEFSSPKSFQIVNQELLSTTLLGFPLRMKVNATGSVTFSQTGKIDMKDTHKILLEGKISPSAVLAMDETLMVDGYICSSGIRRRTTHLARSDFGGRFSLENGQIVDVQFDVPGTEVATVTSSLKVSLFKNLEKDWEEERAESPHVKQKHCSPESISNIIGLQVCYSHNYGTRTFNADVVTEPHETEVTVTKTDTFDNFIFSYKKTDNTVEALFDTPGSSIDRRMNIQVGIKPEGAEGYLVIPGKGIEGQYENSETLKKISLKYRKNSKLQGEFEISLQSITEGINTKYSPKFLLFLENVVHVNVSGSLVRGTDVFRAEGSVMSSFQTVPAEVLASWEHSGGEHKVAAKLTLGQMFSSATGTLFTSPEKMMVQATCEYGTNPAQPHVLSLTIDSSQVVENEEPTTQGYLSIQSSQAEAIMNLDYKHQPGLTEANTNITVRSTKLGSSLMARITDEGETRDMQVTVTFVSPQLDMNYAGHLIYKVSNNALQAEAEVNLGSLMTSKLSLSYLLQDNPLHILLGLHIQYNDFVIQGGYNVDLSKPDKALVLITAAVGPAFAVLHFNADYDHMRPFNTSLEAHCGYGNLKAGFSTLTSSDDSWQHFTGKTEVKWFDLSYHVNHDLLWSESNKHAKLFGGGTSVEATLRSSPNPLFEVVLDTSTDDNEPDFKVSVGKQDKSETYQALVSLRQDQLFHLTTTINMNKTFSGSMHLLESLVQVNGQYSLTDPEHLQCSANIIITLPSGQAFTSELNLSHSYNGITRDIKVSHIHKGKRIEGHVVVLHRDGWFMDDTHGLVLSLTTPFAHLSNLTFAFEKHTDHSSADFVELSWEELKVRGEVQLNGPANMEVKLLYEDGGTCDSHFHLYHTYDGEQYLTGASLRLTQTHSPWAVHAVSSFSHSGNQDSVYIKLDFQCPMLMTPVQLHGVLNSSETHWNFQIQAQMQENLSFIFTTKNAEELTTHKRLVSLELETPWTQPVNMNVTNTYNGNSFNLTLEFWSFLHPVNSLTAEFRSSYADLNDIKAQFYFSHEQLDVTVDLIHNMTSNSLDEYFQGSANSLKFTFDIDTKWDEHLIPAIANGQLSVVNLFDHKFDLSLSHAKETDVFRTELLGSWDDQNFEVNHKLDLSNPGKSISILEATLPNHDIIKTELYFIVDHFSTLTCKFNFISPWTKNIKTDFVIQYMDSGINIDTETLYDGDFVIKVKLQKNGPTHWNQSDFALEVNSSFFEQFQIKWKHNLEDENQFLLEITYGAKFPSPDNEFYFRGSSNLMYNKEMLKQDFEQLDLSVTLHCPSSQIDVSTKVSFDSHFSGDFETKWNDYIFSLTSSIFDGLIFKIISSSNVNYEVEMKYEVGSSSFPDLHFKLMKDGVNVFVLANQFASLYPKFDVLFSLSVLLTTDGTVRNAQLRMKADLSNIKDYAFSGIFKLDSDFKGFEKYWAELDSGVISNSSNVGAHIRGLLHLNKWHYKAILNGSVDLAQDFNLEYQNIYELTHEDKLIDQKDISLSITITDDIIYQGRLSLHMGLNNPMWSSFIYYNKKENILKGYTIPGNSKKYEFQLVVTSNTFTLDIQILSENGSKFEVLNGNVNWNIRKRKKQVSVNMNSDFDAIRKIIGQIILQQKKGLAANAKLRVNEENFTGSLRYISQESKNAGKIIVKVDNNIYFPIKSDTSINFSFEPDKYESDVVVDLNDEKEWLKADLKATLPETHLQLYIPYTELEKMDISLNINTQDVWGVQLAVQAPKFCLDFDGSLDKSLHNSSIHLIITKDCTGQTIFELSFSHDLGRSANYLLADSFDVISYCYVHDYGLIYRYDISWNNSDSMSVAKIEGQFYPQHSFGLLLSQSYGDEFFLIRAYDLHSNITHFLYRHSVTKKNAEIDIKINKHKLISFQAEYDFYLENITIDFTYYHSLFGLSPLNITGEVRWSHNNEAGNSSKIEVGTLKLLTTVGDAEGKIILQKSAHSYSVTADLISNLHSFREYHFKFDHEYLGDNHTFKVISLQDDTEFQIHGSSYSENNMTKINVNFLTPFKDFDHFEISYGYSKSETLESPYEAHIRMILFGSLYGIDINHIHQVSWRNQKTEMMLLSPEDIFSNVSVSLMYNVDDQSAALQLGTSQGSLGIDGAWQHQDTNVIFSLNIDLTLLYLGKYFFDADIPLALSQDGEFRIEHRQADFNFIGHVLTGGNFRHASVSLILPNSNPSLENTTYMLSYKFDSSLNIDGQFESWKANVILEFLRSTFPVLTGSFILKTNIPGYEAVDGSWDIRLRSEISVIQINVNVEQQGTITFSSTVDIQPNGARKAWEKMAINMLFKSPYTLTHHLQAEYDLSAFIVEASYQYGLDNFQIKLNSKLKRKVGTVSLTGNIPVQGLSVFSTNFNYKLKDSYDISLDAAVEETSLQTHFELWPNGTVGSTMLSLTSPYILPVTAALNWSFVESPLHLESSLTYGKHAGELKVILKDIINSKHIEVLIATPFVIFSKLDFRAQYTLTESNQLHISADFGVNHHRFKIESTLINTVLEVSGFMDALEKKGSLKMTVGKSIDVYEGKLFGEITGYEPLHVSISAHAEHFQLSVKYGITTVLRVNINFAHVILEFSWTKHTFSLTLNYLPLNNDIQFKLILNIPQINPLMVHITYSEYDGYKVDGNITIGKTVYNMNSSLLIQGELSSLELYLQSLDSPHTPIIVKAKYDITDFLKWKMNNLTELASASFEWGDAIKVIVTGMSNGNRAKVNIEITTPFKSLPQLNMGCDGELAYENANIDLTATVYVEWSQRITVTGFYKYKNGEIDIHWGLTTPFSELKRLAASLKFTLSHIEFSLVNNNDKWRILCDYQLSPFSLTLTAQTPISGFETISFVISSSSENGLFDIQAELSWQNNNTVRIHVQAEFWKMAIEFNSPWEPFQKVIFVAELRTESEELMYTSALEWNMRKAKMTIIYSPVQFQLIGRYEENNAEIALAKVEYVIHGQEFKSKVEIITPFKALKSLEAELNLGLGDQEFKIKLNIYGKISFIEGIFSITGGRITVDIPSLEDFTWTLEASNMWMRMDMEASLIYPRATSPLTIKLDYDINSNNGIGRLHAKFENLCLWLEFLNFTLTVNHSEFLAFVETSSTLFIKLRNQDLSQYKVNVSSSTVNDQVSSSFAFIAYEVTFKLSLLNIFLEEGNIEFVLSSWNEQICKFYYETVFPSEHSSNRRLSFECLDWAVNAQATLTEESISFLFSYPEPTIKHTLLLTWDENLSLENFRVEAELNSPYIEKSTFYMHFMVQQQFSFSLDSGISYGSIEIDVKGIFQYIKKLRQANCDVHVTSDWVGTHAFRANIRWLNNITANVKLNSLDQKHSIKLHVDTTDRSVEITCNSAWLPYENIVITGTVNHDFEPLNIVFEGQLIGNSGINKMFVKAVLASDGLQNATLLASLIKNQETIFKISVLGKLVDQDLTLTLTVDSIIPELRVTSLIQCYNMTTSGCSGVAMQSYFLEDFEIYITINENWRDNQRIYVYTNGYVNELSFRLGTEEGDINIIVQSVYSSFNLHSRYSLLDNFEIICHFKTSLETLQLFNLRAKAPDIRDGEVFTLLYRGQNNPGYSLKIFSPPDSVMGRSIAIYITTQVKGYEKFSFVSPTFYNNDEIFRVMLEYPTGKIGIILKFGNFISDMQFSIYMPFEDYEIISLRLIADFNDAALEIRVGKLGITLSVTNLGRFSHDLLNLEFVIRINENKIKTKVLLILKKDDSILSLHTDFYPQDLVGVSFFLIECRYNENERIHLVVKNDQEELFKTHVAWGSDKVFALTTPKRYPCFLILNLESTKQLNDYHIKVGITLKEDGTWEAYSFHVHQEILDGGRHLSLSGEAEEHQFHVEGTFSVNPFHWNESLIFELNRRKFGYKVLLQRDPGFYNSIYLSHINIFLPTRSLRYDANATYSSRTLEMLSSLTWNEYDPEMLPFIIKLNYNDNSLFGHKKHYLTTVLSHPAIKDVIIQGNITQLRNSPLYGKAELRDGNSPEKNIVMTLAIQPNLDSKEHNVLVNISQPLTGLVLSMDAHVIESIFNKGDYTFKYWNLTKEAMKELKISTAVNKSDAGYDFAANVLTSQAQWGYSYNGNIHFSDNLAEVKIQGSSLRLGEFWKFGTSINKHLPELIIHLEVGQNDQEAYEEGRLRIGLHNPVELGAVLDHKRFGKWSQDSAVGLRILESDILQFIVEYDPSLDYSESSSWASLTSPADKILDSWQRDATYTVSVFKQWIARETQAALDVLVNTQTLQAVWDSEKNSLKHYISDYNEVVTSVTGGVAAVWIKSVKPLVDTPLRLIYSGYEKLEAFLQVIASSIRQQFDRMIESFEVEWESAVNKLTPLYDQLVSWWETASTQTSSVFTDLKYQLVEVMNIVRNVPGEFLTSIKEDFEPIFESMKEVFIRYGQELNTVFYDHCWNLVQQMVEELIADVLESVNSSADSVKEFFQLEEYHRIILQAKNNAVALLDSFYTVVHGGVNNFKDVLLDSSFMQALQQTQEQIYNFFSEISAAEVYYYVEHGVSALEPQVSAAAEDIFQLWGENIEALKEYSSENIFFNYINIAAGNVYERVLVIWQSWRQEELHDLSTFEQALVSFFDVIEAFVNDEDDDDDSSITESSFVFEPSKYGKIMYNQYLPVPWKNFLEPPQWYKLTNLFKKESPILEVQRLLAEGVDSVESGWEALRQPGALLPPFIATATIYGQHITTFDLHHYQFLGPCSYLLTRDFISGDFSVIGVYKSKAGVVQLESIVVLGHSANVTLHVDGTINVTEAGAETYTNGDHSGVKLDGLLVTCNKVYQGCSITVSGKYFGRLAGLLGNYNYEPSDDTRGPDGSRTYNAAHLATQWALSSTPCYQANQAVKMEDVSAAEGVDECAQLFLRSASPFSTCYFLVDPKPYFWHCINSHNQLQFGNDEGGNFSCKAAASYHTQCLAQGVHVPSPHHCYTEEKAVTVRKMAAVPRGTCDVNGETVPAGWMHMYQAHAEGSADIVLIVELANCNKDRNLQQLLKLVKVQLRKSGISDVRYALITVQGETISPVSPFMNDEDMSTLLGTLVLEGPKVDTGGAAAVISAAKNSRWRVGVSRSIMQMSCRACDEGDAVLEALHLNDVVFHLITKFKVIMQGPDKKKSAAMAIKLIGFDEKFVYTPKDIKKFTGTEKLRAALQEPEGSCVVAAQASGGSVFNINKWITNNNEAAKKFFRVLSLRVAASSSAPECQECKCFGHNTETTLLCYKCSHSKTIQDMLVVSEAPQAEMEQVEDVLTEANYSVKSDIKRDFIEQFVDENAAFALLRNTGESGHEESSESDESDEDDSHSGNEEEKQEDKQGEEDKGEEVEEIQGKEEMQGQNKDVEAEERLGEEEYIDLSYDDIDYNTDTRHYES
ncbi:hypothetical protein OTU49_008718 [Cherax quadricarinatus]|uniref:Vitellogenin n=1 Tax=Cherax quadricarinatus TaxID=27406 RepID=A0AAW0WNC4_CHEQU